jgi:hypothetical protein
MTQIAVLATSLFGDVAPGFCEDASTKLPEHPARLRVPNLAVHLVSIVIGELAPGWLVGRAGRGYR